VPLAALGRLARVFASIDLPAPGEDESAASEEGEEAPTTLALTSEAARATPPKYIAM
jgi:hypothetical protein